MIINMTNWRYLVATGLLLFVFSNVTLGSESTTSLTSSITSTTPTHYVTKVISATRSTSSPKLITSPSATTLTSSPSLSSATSATDTPPSASPASNISTSSASLTSSPTATSTPTASVLPPNVTPEVPRLFTVELLVVVDHSIYQHYMDVSSTQNEKKRIRETEQAIREHYMELIHEVNGRLSTLNNSMFALNAAISDIYIIKNESEATWRTRLTYAGTLDASTTLSMFNDVLGSFNVTMSYDHAMLFTRHDLTHDDSDAIAGYAYLSKMCSSDSVSVVEELMTSQVYQIAVHELGHSLGAKHDGENNDCPTDDNNIMSETFSISRDLDKNRNSWRFSHCSTEYISGFLQHLDKIGNNCLDNPINDPTKGKQPGDNDETNTYEVPSPDIQCAQRSDTESYLCRSLYGTNYTELCALMYCSIDDKTCSFQLPLDGTPCGHAKICRSGYCVYQMLYTEKDPVLSDACPFGDQPGPIDGSQDSCAVIITRKPFLCYQEKYRYRCCRACAMNYTGVVGCEYGNRFEHCGSSGRLDCLFNSEDCCQICAYYSQTMSELLHPVCIGGGSLLVVVMAFCLIRRIRRQRRLKRGRRSQTQFTDRHDSGMSSRRHDVHHVTTPSHVPHPYDNHNNTSFPYHSRDIPLSTLRCSTSGSHLTDWPLNSPLPQNMGIFGRGPYLGPRTMAALACLQGVHPSTHHRNALADYGGGSVNLGSSVTVLSDKGNDVVTSRLSGHSYPTIEEVD